MKWKMLFKFGITVIVFIAIYLYFALKSEDGSGVNISKSGIDTLNEDVVPAKEHEDDAGVEKNSKHVPKSDNARSDTENIR